ncbi:Dynein heavy chain 6, axonemal [Bagarius yarrelli]|uniref:Dynein heavy chain 6, axonemal n=1 Tax=Bagarius yarrelli TaxID=175774 RepID=A0A556U8G4_BAGYA|nr:Dynein heavy chain 6, axonemal [Bagarius yarrelli]
MSSPYPGNQTREDGANRASGLHSPSLPPSLVPVDPEMLMSRLITTGPVVSQHDPNALVFLPHTRTQHRQHGTSEPMRQEMLPVIKQPSNQPEKHKRTSPSSSALHLPQISDHLKKRQTQLSQGSSSPAKKPRSSSKSHTLSPLPPTSHMQRFSSVEEVIRTGIHSPCEITQIIRNNPHLGFFYMTQTRTSKSSFDLKIVPYVALNKSNYYTISAQGVTHYSSEGTTFRSLESWEQEYFHHQRLLRIPTFALFRKRKAFRLWRANVRFKTIKICKCALLESLFVMNEILRPALINIRELCFHIRGISLCRIEKQRTYTLKEFQSAQYAQLDEVSSRLREFRELVKEVAVTACYTALLEAGEPEQNADTSVPPVFITELMLDTQALFFQPSLKDFQESVADIISRFQETVLCLEPLVRDSDFDAFTRPIINNKIQEKSCGDGPDLEATLENDQHLQHIIRTIKNLIQSTFDTADTYAHTFKPLHLFYKENESLDLKALAQQDHNLEFFSERLKRYHSQHKEALAAINDMLPMLAKRKMDAAIAEIQDACFKLELVPTSTIEYVNSLTFLEEIQERSVFLDEEVKLICEMYKLIESYSVPTPPEDLAVFGTLQPSRSSLGNTVDKAVGERDANVTKFCQHLQQDIKELTNEVTRVKQQAENRILLDINANRDQVRTLLREIQQSIDEMQEQAFRYKSYQKNFKVEVTKHDSLEELSAEVKLKNLLWDSLEEWDKLQSSWMQSKFHDLDPETLNVQVNKYSKYVNLLEKGLPPNNVVPYLKTSVAAMKQKLPVIIDLLNPCLKERHWIMLENIVGVNLLESSLTLDTLRELDVFNYATEIVEISGQASGEAALETVVKKVEDSWKTTEFVVLLHRDCKDVFILGGTDEIQVMLDDSCINMATVASSRYVGPIKAKVDDWQHQLSLFSQTLEEWLTCQRNWLYLESIFTAPDIQRQLPAEAKMFLQVDKSWKDIMRKVNSFPNALRAATQPGLLEIFQSSNALLDQIQKCLEAYLESKRVVFPRFYFLSNDELLEILAQTRNPQAVQPHLRKCFDAISRLEFALQADSDSEAEKVYSNDILAMISPEGEKVALGKGLKARGNVEDWLGKVEEAMFTSLRRLSKAAIPDYQSKPRVEWVVAGHPSQVVLTISQLMWCRDMDNCLEGDHDHFEALQQFEITNFERLNALAALVRGNLPKIHRNIITALITVDVHARDIVTGLVKEKVDSSSNFEWQRQLRYYWDLDLDNCVARMALSQYIYGYEYLGACPRLVITPLTDRCYLCLMGALQLDLGGAPAGPAGTGKTETTKDLAKALAIQCVVFNCSDGLDYKMMGTFFSGLAQSGAWCCFDEFNRINIEVLSVIAQQLITIRSAKAAKLSRFMFEGREIKLVMTCAAFITMNPGYAGRTELPDNLKALFRPIAMMVPNYALIAEMYKLCSEQLSQQDHYDFGMRAVKSVLVMAGSLKRENPHLSEEVVLIRALRDSNLPKFLKDDAELFSGILSDLFPGVHIPEHDYGALQVSIEEALKARSLQPVSSMTGKVIQLYETMLVRHGVMLVGPTGGGKTTVYLALADALLALYEAEGCEANPFYQPVKTYVLNPKSVSMGELYGEANPLTLEWRDGLMALCVRAASNDQSDTHKWVISDGPVDALCGSRT